MPSPQNAPLKSKLLKLWQNEQENVVTNDIEQETMVKNNLYKLRKVYQIL